ncbi:MAG TPA: PDZ domain-containing protein [Candidatus Acidoferrales bacterium]|nr:PDZ domain-containing protein [Candidatus Acidoferrales bacterium]
MRNRTFVFLMGMVLVTIGIVALPWTLRSQERTAPPAPQTGCDASAESLQALLASHGWRLSHELQAQLRALQSRLAAEEAEMTSQLPNADDLRASLEGAKAELAAAKAQEVESHIQSLLGQEPGAYLVEEGGSGYLGIEISEVSADKAKELKLPAVRGVLVTEVESDSPAAKAGLQAGDVITSFDRQEVEGTVQFRRLVHETPPGRSTPLVVIRNGGAQNLSIEVGDRLAKMELQVQRMPRVFNMPDFNFEMPEVFGGMTPMLGINAEDLNGQLGDYFGVPGGEGVLVREVHRDTPAEKAGLKAGDVITQVDGAPVKTVGDLREQLQSKREQKTVSLSLLRKGASMTVNVAIEPPRAHEHTHITRRVAT